MPRRKAIKHRIERNSAASVRSWEQPSAPVAKRMKSDAVLDMGWGKLLFAHTFAEQQAVVELLRDEKRGERHVAFYVRDPHVMASLSPSELFIDPSHTYRLWLHEYRFGRARPKGVAIRRIQTREDVEAINRIYATRAMVLANPDYLWAHRKSRVLLYIVAEDCDTGEILGACAGADHEKFFHDPERGSSLWSLAVDPQAAKPGVGEALVRYLAEHYQATGHAYMDLSVMHDNREAVLLYEKLGFRRVPVFCLKHKNSINESLYAASAPEESLNPYADIIIREARRRGINVDVLDAERAYFVLAFGGRSIICRESLTELTSAVAMSWCDDKRMTIDLLRRAGLRVPAQRALQAPYDGWQEFLDAHPRVVIKPARGEQGQGISVDLSEPTEIKVAIDAAATVADTVLMEEMVAGQDVRIIVIDYKVVAAATRQPPRIVGDGQHTIVQLIDKLSRRRAAATGGESQVPMDAETSRCVRAAGYELDDVLPADVPVVVRKTANLHTGGTIHDVTDQIQPGIIKAAEQAARTLTIPVVGLDFLMPTCDGTDYVIIEANERPGLANHEPQPTAERFIDFLFPRSRIRRPFEGEAI